jgi:hypothetical protein
MRTAASGCSLPLTSVGGAVSPSKTSATCRQIDSLTRISPGAAKPRRRAAVLTASPVSAKSPARASLRRATTRPELMPVCIRSDRAGPEASVATNASTAWCSSIAAVTALRASCWCASGTPKSAMISSPTN